MWPCASVGHYDVERSALVAVAAQEPLPLLEAAHELGLRGPARERLVDRGPGGVAQAKSATRSAATAIVFLMGAEVCPIRVELASLGTGKIDG